MLAETIEAQVPGVSGMLVLPQWQGRATVWSFTPEAPIEDLVRRYLRELLATQRAAWAGTAGSQRTHWLEPKPDADWPPDAGASA